MTEREKRIAIIGVTIVAAIILLLWLRRGGLGSGSIVAGNSDYVPANIAGITTGPLYTGSDTPFTWDIPGLNLGGPNLSMMGACCSDCMAGPMAQAASQPPMFSYGLSGAAPVSFNYAEAPVQWTVHSNIVDAAGNILVQQY